MLKPWLLLSPSMAHKIAPMALFFWSQLFGKRDLKWNHLKWRGLTFKNRLGVAGGLDKNAEMVETLWNLGSGFVEVGTITPEAQDANPGIILDRDLGSKTTWNKMGFPNDGAKEIAFNLRDLTHKETPLFINIGKNRNTPIEKASDDYVSCVNQLIEYADAFVVNISSPNTQGLRNLQNADQLKILLEPILKAAKSTPVLLKLSPDMNSEDFKSTILTATSTGVSGFILTNTTLSRSPNSKFPTEGGISGEPLAELSKKALQECLQILGENRKNMLIVSAGGVLSPQDVLERLQLGADLVQIYSALIFEGPSFFNKTANFMNQGDEIERN